MRLFQTSALLGGKSGFIDSQIKRAIPMAVAGSLTTPASGGIHRGFMVEAQANPDAAASQEHAARKTSMAPDSNSK